MLTFRQLETVLDWMENNYPARPCFGVRFFSVFQPFFYPILRRFLMSWKTKTNDKGANFGELPPAGTHPAVLIGLIDLGTHEETYQGKATPPKRKVMLVWELVTEKMSGMKDSNHVIANRYTFSLASKATLRKVLEDWRGKKYGDDEEVDISAVLGKSCLLSVNHTQSGDRTFANVAGVQQVVKGMAVPPAQRKPVEWQVGYDLDQLPDWLPYLYGEPVAEVVKRCHELTGRSKAEPNGESDSEPVGAGAGQGQEIPF